MPDTLFDRIMKFHEISLKKSSVRVPKLRPRKKPAAARSPNESAKIPLSTILSLIIKSVSEEKKKEAKAAKEETAPIKVIEEKPSETSGYGTIQKNYGTLPSSSYVDYAALFSYLGKFAAAGSYGNNSQPSDGSVNPMAQSTGLVSKETMDKAGRYIKYMAGGYDLDALSMVPKAGMSASEWENFKLWVKLDPVMYRLKVSTS